MQIDGTDIDAVHAAAEFSIADIRNGRGPRFVWATVPRMCSHSCVDDGTVSLKKVLRFRKMTHYGFTVNA